MEQRRTCAAAGQHEAREFGQQGVVVIDRLLDARDVGFEDAQRDRARVGDDRRREVGAHVEEVVLYAEQQFLDVDWQPAERKDDA